MSFTQYTSSRYVLVLARLLINILNVQYLSFNLITDKFANVRDKIAGNEGIVIRFVVPIWYFPGNWWRENSGKRSALMFENESLLCGKTSFLVSYKMENNKGNRNIFTKEAISAMHSEYRFWLQFAWGIEFLLVCVTCVVWSYCLHLFENLQHTFMHPFWDELI